YLEALLEVARGLVRARALPAALMLREAHLKDRIELLLEEVHMSKTRIVLSLAASAVALVAAAAVAAWSFPVHAVGSRDGAAAVRQWRYEPSGVGPTRATITVRFILDKGKGKDKP